MPLLAPRLLQQRRRVQNDLMPQSQMFQKYSEDLIVMLQCLITQLSCDQFQILVQHNQLALQQFHHLNQLCFLLSQLPRY